ncbi:MAG: hypothetical protein Q7J25_05295 [Vicinamibacterales bacterium]|nr:hypothetical protein [Vicinamibacterales bacterium]
MLPFDYRSGQAMGANTEMDERLTSLEEKVEHLPTAAEMVALAEEMTLLGERVYGVEDRHDAALEKFEITAEALRADVKLVLDQIDNLRKQMQDGFASVNKVQLAERQLLYSLVKDHTRRLRAIERLENRRRRSTVALGTNP